jgi:hypothetical protein
MDNRNQFRSSRVDPATDPNNSHLSSTHRYQLTDTSCVRLHAISLLKCRRGRPRSNCLLRIQSRRCKGKNAVFGDRLMEGRARVGLLRVGCAPVSHVGTVLA